MQDQGLFCAKQAAQGRGVGTLPGCPAGQQNQAGLCYNACPSATDGVGVVCWGQCAKTPAYPVDCGAMCGQDAAACVRAGGSMALTTVKFVADAIKGDVPDVDAVFKAYALDICSDAQMKKQTKK